MTKQKVRLTKNVSVNLPSVPNFIIHSAEREEVVPIRLFRNMELRKIGKAWTDALIKKARRPTPKTPCP